MKTVIALYDVFTDAQAAVRDLMQAGVDQDDISLIGPERQPTDVRNAGAAATPEGQDERELAAARADVATWDDDVAGLAPLAVPGIGPVMAIGPLAAGYSGSASAVGGDFSGVLLGWGLPDEDADTYAEGLRRGGTLVLATVADGEVEIAGRIMNKYDPTDLKSRSTDWRQTGWTGFDAEAQPYTGGTLTDEVAHATRGAYSRSYAYPDAMTSTDTDAGTTAHEASYRQHYDANYAGAAYDYRDYQSAYRFGSTLGGNNRLVDLGRWEDIEPAARAQWEDTHNEPWDDFKEAIRHGWNEMRQAVS